MLQTTCSQDPKQNFIGGRMGQYFFWAIRRGGEKGGERGGESSNSRKILLRFDLMYFPLYQGMHMWYSWTFLRHCRPLFRIYRQHKVLCPQVGNHWFHLITSWLHLITLSTNHDIQWMTANLGQGRRPIEALLYLRAQVFMLTVQHRACWICPFPCLLGFRTIQTLYFVR